MTAKVAPTWAKTRSRTRGSHGVCALPAFWEAPVTAKIEQDQIKKSRKSRSVGPGSILGGPGGPRRCQDGPEVTKCMPCQHPERPKSRPRCPKLRTKRPKSPPKIAQVTAKMAQVTAKIAQDTAKMARKS